LEQVWFIRNVTGGFRAIAGGFFQRVIASSRAHLPLAPSLFFFSDEQFDALSNRSWHSFEYGQGFTIQP
jgi:hypothetical protein